MESRKIQTVGGGTYTVSLPKTWAEAHDLEAGSTVDLHTHVDGVLVVEAREPEAATGPVRVAVDDEPPVHLERTLRAAYAAGVSAVRFETTDGFDGDQRRRIEAVARTMTGVTVAGESATQVTVRTLLDPGSVSLAQSVRQLTFVALSMHRDATAALSADGGIELADRDEQADRLAAMVDRHFARGLDRLDEIDALGRRRPALFELWTTARQLERVADHAERIAATARGVATDDDTVALLDDLAATARGVVEDAVSVIIDDAGVETAREALRARDSVRERATRIERERFDPAATDYRLVRVLDSLRRTAELGGNVAETGLRAAVRCGQLAEPITVDTGTGDGDPLDTVADAGGRSPRQP